MALVLKDRVQQTGTATTTPDPIFTLTGTVTGFQSFAAVGNDNDTYYAATDLSGNWEVGIGRYLTAGSTINRNTILSSSNAGSAVTAFSNVTVFCTYPSQIAVITNVAQTLTNKRITPRVTTNSTSPSSEVRPNADTDDQYNALALDTTATIYKPTGTPTDGQRLTLRLNSAVGATTLTWNTGVSGGYIGSGITLPTSLIEYTYIGCIYNASTLRWNVTAITGPL
jgi:hypothetical protein